MAHVETLIDRRMTVVKLLIKFILNLLQNKTERENTLQSA